MDRRLQNSLLASVLALLFLPLPAFAAGIFAPYILHPVRREITADEIKSADQVFAQIGATRTDLVATASDGVVLRGWKVRAAHPTGNWVLLLHGRSQNRLSMLGYAKFLLNSAYN